ncbi:hypothetical protein BDW68DRAFT_93844 [Aspergillus falconensis]
MGRRGDRLQRQSWPSCGVSGAAGCGGFSWSPPAESNQGGSIARVRLSLTAWDSGSERKRAQLPTSPSPGAFGALAQPAIIILSIMHLHKFPTGTESSAYGVLQSYHVFSVATQLTTCQSTPDFPSGWTADRNSGKLISKAFSTGLIPVAIDKRR